MKWFINLRWFAALLCLTTAVALYVEILPMRLSAGLFMATGGLLIAANGLFTAFARSVRLVELSSRRIERFLIVQILVDFLGLSVLTYASGSVATPVTFLFMLHIALATLFLDRLRSLLVTGIAWVLAAIPLSMKWPGILAPRVDLDLYLPTDWPALAIYPYLGSIAGVYLAGWYLFSTITSSLAEREKELEAANERLVNLSQEKARETLRATHELKAPFAAIKSYVYTLRDGYCGELPEAAQEVVHRIGVRCDRLMQSITDIIHLGNLRTMVLADVHFSSVDLIDLLEREIQEARLIGEERDITIHMETVGDEQVMMHASAAHLRTLFSNLLRNAVTYSHLGGHVGVIVEKTPSQEVTVSIADEGIGIPPEHLDKIFGEFFRSKGAVEHHPNGSGIGLALVKEIVHLHGASISVTSTLGEGTTFVLHFDLSGRRIRRKEVKNGKDPDRRR